MHSKKFCAYPYPFLPSGLPTVNWIMYEWTSFYVLSLNNMYISQLNKVQLYWFVNICN